MLNTNLDRKIFMAQRFLDSAQLHELTQNCVIGSSVEETLAKRDDTALGRKLVTHFLYVMVKDWSWKIVFNRRKRNNFCSYRGFHERNRSSFED